MADSLMLEFALKYANSGLRVIPVRPRGKLPLTQHGAHDSTTDEGTIRSWWGIWPDANIGMTLGDLVAVDIDPRNGGDQDQLPEKLPETSYAKTGGGGFHYLYRSNGRAMRYPGHPAPGIDVKTGPGAYIVVEPSVHPSGGNYCWLDETEPWRHPPAEVPEWLAKIPEAAPHGNAEGKVGAGGRNDYLTRHAGSMRRRGMEPAAILAALLAENTLKCSPPLPDEDVQKIAASVGRYAPAEEPPLEGSPTKPSITEWPKPLDLDELDSTEPEPPKFIMQDWLPCGYATLVAGHGGVGKSGIALHLAVCIAAGIQFFGLPVERRRILYLSCEDRKSILHWRLARICSHLGIRIKNLKGWFDILDLVGHDVVLWERDPHTGNTVTPAFGRVAEQMKDPHILVVDGISDTYAGNENARTEVKRYVNALVALIPPDIGAVLLVGHIAKPAASVSATSEGYSGTTGWHNAVRARWYLYPETAQEEEDSRPRRTGRLLLELQKSNLGRMDQVMRFKWDEQDRMFIGEDAQSTTFDRKHQDRTEQAGILASIQACENAQIPVPTAMQGPRTAYLVLSRRPEFPPSLKGGNREKTTRFRRHFENLRQLHLLEESSYRRSNRHMVAIFRLTTEGRAECALFA